MIVSGGEGPNPGRAIKVLAIALGVAHSFAIYLKAIPTLAAQYW